MSSFSAESPTVGEEIRAKNRKRRTAAVLLFCGSAVLVVLAVISGLSKENPLVLPAPMFLLLAAGLVAIAMSLTLSARRELLTWQTANDLGLTFALKLQRDQVAPLFDLPMLPSISKTSEVLESLLGNYQGHRVILARLKGDGGESSFYQRIAALMDGGKKLPEFALSPEDYLLDKISHLFGRGDIDFDANAESIAFSKQFKLRGKDEAAVRRAFGPAVMHYLTEHPGWCLQSKDGWLVAYRCSAFNALTSLKADEARQQLDTLLGIQAAFEQDQQRPPSNGHDGSRPG